MNLPRPILLLMLLLGAAPAAVALGARSARPAPRAPAARATPARIPATRPPVRPAPSTRPAPTAASLGPVTEVTLERSSGFSPAPTYRITLRRDGTALYTGIANTDRVGQYRGTVSQLEFNRLSNLIQTLRFLTLKPRYITEVELNESRDGPRIAWETPPTVTTAVSWGGTRKTVVNEWDAAPMELWTIEKTVQGIASQIDWVPASARTTPRIPLGAGPPAETETDRETPARRLGDGTSGVRGVVLDGPVLLEGSGNERQARPMTNATLIVRSENSRQELTRTRTDDRGRFEVSLPAGTYVLSLYDPRSPQTRVVSVRTTVHPGRWSDVVMEYIVDMDGNTIIDNPNVGDEEIGMEEEIRVEDDEFFEDSESER